MKTPWPATAKFTHSPFDAILAWEDSASMRKAGYLSDMALSNINREAQPASNEVAGAGFNDALLENPIWNALRTEHSAIALCGNTTEDLARRYPAAIGPLSGIPKQRAESYDALRGLAGVGEPVGLFLSDPPALPQGWSLFRGGMLTQMICRTPQLNEPHTLPDGVSLSRLGAAHVEAMVELAALTEPGPFRKRTIELGNFYGILEGDRLLAMAGQRMRVPGFVEVSAVCTHPEGRGRGYAGILMGAVMRDIAGEGATPFLHAFAENPAVRLYERLGFAHRRSFHLAVIQREE